VISLLVDVEVDGFKAVLPEFRSLPMRKIAPIVTNHDIMDATTRLIDLLRSELPEDKIEEFENLEMITVFAFIERWTHHEA
jgi:hypothetical protein